MPLQENKYGMSICFVIMPFGQFFDTFYKKTITPSIKSLDLVPLRADEINNPGVIVDQIWKGINNSKICIADITNQNSNVMYELGLAHAIGKPVIQIVQDIKDIPFDLRHLRHIIYKPNESKWKDDFKKTLESMLNETLTNSEPLFSKENFEEGKDSLIFEDFFAIGKAGESMLKMLGKATIYCKNLSNEESQKKIHEIWGDEIENTENRVLKDKLESFLGEFILKCRKNPKIDRIELLRSIIDKLDFWIPDYHK